MTRYQEIIGKINYGLFLAVILLLPFPQIALRYACTLWIVSWFLEGRWLSKPLSLRENKIAIPFLLFGIWYGWKALSGLWAPDAGTWALQMERYMTFGMLVPVGIWGVNQYYNWQTAGKVLIIGCVAAIFFYPALLTAFYLHPELISYCNLQATWNYAPMSYLFFIAEHISIFKHRLFFCSVEIFGAIIAWHFFRHQLKILIPALLAMVSSLIISGSRQSILTVIALLAISLLYYLPRRKRWAYGLLTLVAAVLIGGTILKFHPRTEGLDITQMLTLREVDHGRNIRFNIWGFALQEPENYIAHGLGAGQSTYYLCALYQEAGFADYVYENFHPHNQYLEELMEIGIPGLVFFLIAWLSILYCAPSGTRTMAWQFVTIYVFNMFTDSMCAKFCGIGLWAVGMIFIFLQPDAEREEQTTGNTETH